MLVFRRRIRHNTGVIGFSCRCTSSDANNGELLKLPRKTSYQICITYTECSDDSWREIIFGKHEHGALWLLICGALEENTLSYLLKDELLKQMKEHLKGIQGKEKLRFPRNQKSIRRNIVKLEKDINSYLVFLGDDVKIWIVVRSDMVARIYRITIMVGSGGLESGFWGSL